ncbi:MAG TPA: acyltransferase [Rhizomicrobium sp.]
MRSGPGHIPSLDGLRAISVMLVILSHTVSATLFPGGLGVLVFFVISGFLITRLILVEWNSTQTLRKGRFWWRRFWRLGPAVLAYCIAVPLWALANGKTVHAVEPLASIFYFANFLYAYYSVFSPTGHLPLEHFWSLSVEEHFYWVFPFVFVACRGRANWLAKAMFAFCVTCLLARIAIVSAWPSITHSRVIYYTDVRADSIGFGVLLAAMCELEAGRRLVSQLTRPPIFLAAASGIALCLLDRNLWFRETVRYSLEGTSIAILLAAILFSPRYLFVQRLLNYSPMVWVGILSYSLYVWHPLVAIALQRLETVLPHLIWAAVAISATFVVASISFYGIEAPLRARFAGRFSN